MNEPAAGRQPDPGRYEIRLKGHLAPRWAAWFDGMNLTNRSDGTTTLDGPVVDEAALHGLLTKLRDLGLPLVSLRQVDSDAQPDTSFDACDTTPEGD